jgi:hypothetical protein
MERLLSRVLFTFSVGFALIGVVVGLLNVNTGEYCGAVLSHDQGCRQPVSLLAMMLAFWGVALTCAVGGTVADAMSPEHRAADLVEQDGAEA